MIFPVSERKPKIRRTVEWNTGERVHKPKKGKGSYDRKNNKNETKEIFAQIPSPRNYS